MTTVKDVKVFELKEIIEPEGRLIPAELKQLLPKEFEVKRVFFVDNVKDNELRGLHAHYETEQLLFCIKGQLKVVCKDGTDAIEVILDKPNMCVYVPKMIWDEQVYLTKDTIMLSIASTQYSPGDYINSYEIFVKEKHASKN